MTINVERRTAAIAVRRLTTACSGRRFVPPLMLIIRQASRLKPPGTLNSILKQAGLKRRGAVE